MRRKTYSLEFKEQALCKSHQRGQRTLQEVADDLNLSLGTLKTWLKESDKIRGSSLPTNSPALNWTPAQRLAALCESHALKDQDWSAWCREKGLFEHQFRPPRNLTKTSLFLDNSKQKAFHRGESPTSIRNHFPLGILDPSPMSFRHNCSCA